MWREGGIGENRHLGRWQRRDIRGERDVRSFALLRTVFFVAMDGGGKAFPEGGIPDPCHGVYGKTTVRNGKGCESDKEVDNYVALVASSVKKDISQLRCRFFGIFSCRLARVEAQEKSS
jgi:hypothetical protein